MPLPPTALPPTAQPSRRGSEELPSELYPEPKIRWYKNVEEHPSIWNATGLQPVALEQPALQPVQESGGCRAGGWLFVFVASAHGLAPAPGEASGSGRYRASAYYQSEARTAMEERKTDASASSRETPASREECTFDRDIHVPFNSREQFLKVAVFRVDASGDDLIGEATVPIADPDVSSLSAFPLLRDFEQQGLVKLSVRLPDASEPPMDPVEQAPLTPSNDCRTPLDAAATANGPSGASRPVGGTAEDAAAFQAAMELALYDRQHRAAPLGAQADCASPQVRAVASTPQGTPTHAGSASPTGSASPSVIAAGLRIGADVEIFSKSNGQWLHARVSKIEAYKVTVEYGERFKVVDLRAPNLHEHLRWLERGSPTSFGDVATPEIALKLPRQPMQAALAGPVEAALSWAPPVLQTPFAALPRGGGGMGSPMSGANSWPLQAVAGVRGAGSVPPACAQIWTQSVQRPLFK